MSRLSYFFAPPLEEVLDQLEAEGIVESINREQASFTVEGVVQQSPWYIQLFAAIGVWIAAICFFAVVAFLCAPFTLGFSIEMIQLNFIIAGLFLCGIAKVLQADVTQQDSISMTQLTFATALAGQILLVVGVILQQEFSTASLSIIVIQTICLFVYTGKLQRFISISIITGCLMAFFGDQRLYWGIIPLTIALAVGTVFVWVRHPFVEDKPAVREFLRVLLYALPLQMLVVLLLPLTDLEISWRVSIRDFHQPEPITVGLVVLVLVTEALILRNYGIHPRERISLAIYASTVLIAIPSFSIPGIMAAMLVMILGFWRNNAVMMGVATAFLAGFIGLFYYFLDATLYFKGITLITTGGVLLILWLLTSAHNFRRKKVRL